MIEIKDSEKQIRNLVIIPNINNMFSETKTFAEGRCCEKVNIFPKIK